MVFRRFGSWTQFPSCFWLDRTTNDYQLSCSGCVVLFLAGAQDEMWPLWLVGEVKWTLHLVTAQGRTVGDQLSFYQCTSKMETTFTDRKVAKISYLGDVVCQRTFLSSLFYFGFVWFACFFFHGPQFWILWYICVYIYTYTIRYTSATTLIKSRLYIQYNSAGHTVIFVIRGSV